jgi:hypothetical protein
MKTANKAPVGQGRHLVDDKEETSMQDNMGEEVHLLRSTHVSSSHFFRLQLLNMFHIRVPNVVVRTNVMDRAPPSLWEAHRVVL